VGVIPDGLDPYALFATWMDDATRTELNDPNAVALATVDERGSPSVRMVLLKGVDPRGFVVYTNLSSRKGKAMSRNPRAALCFHWKSLRRQIRVEGDVEAVSDDEADAYFASRGRDSRIGAWASRQSDHLSSREELQARVRTYEERFAGTEVPRPPYWSGFRVLPERIEFWLDQPNRLHDRLQYLRDGERWATGRLYP
jgi:pyridoxamine 5'-phosphate oxidase